MPLLPIDKVIKNPRFFAHGALPQGMTHNAARLVNGTGLPSSTLSPTIAAPASFAETKSRASPREDSKESKSKGWNARTTVHTDRDTFEGMSVVSLLRAQHHRTSTGANGLTAGASRTAAGQMLAGGAEEGADGKNMTISASRRSSALHRQSSFSQAANSAATAAGPSSPAKLALEEVQKEVDSLLSALYAENAVAQQTLQQQEETLASKYLDLEANAHLYSTADYEMALQRLEQERVEYENERQRVDDYFHRKVALIQARRDDAYRRDYANQRKAFADLAQSIRGGGMTMSELSPTKAASGQGNDSRRAAGQTGSMQATGAAGGGQGERGATRRSPRPKDTQSAEEKERGWIRLSSAKMNTHNYHLRTKQLESSQAFISKITPRKLLNKTQLAGTSSAAAATALPVTISTTEPEDELAATYRSSFPPGAASAEEVIMDAFHRFKHRLHIHTTRWNTARNRHRTTLAEYVQSSPKPAPEHAHIALPDKAFQPVVMSKEEVMYAQRLRAEELPLMHYEDERRRIVLAEASLQVHLQEPVVATPATGLHSTHHLMASAGSMATPFMQTGGGYSHATGGMYGSPMPQSPSPYRSSPPRSPSPGAMGHQPSAVEIDAAYRFLSASRPLIICDRAPKEYVFQLVDRRAGQVGFLSSILEWKEFSAFTSQEVLAGSIVLEDIAALAPTVDHEVFTIHLHEGARALKNAKGRTQVVLRCAGVNDCLKYINALTILLAVR